VYPPHVGIAGVGIASFNRSRGVGGVGLSSQLGSGQAMKEVKVQEVPSVKASQVLGQGNRA
jgi:hypothetical protein